VGSSHPATFHPAVSAWFRRAFPDGPTAAQAAAWPSIGSGRNTLVAAPTGSGKTLTAFMTAIDSLVRRGLEPGGLPDETVVLCLAATDPANLLGSVLPGKRVPRVTGSRVLYRDGIAVAIQVAGRLEWLQPLGGKDQVVAKNLLMRGPGATRLPPVPALLARASLVASRATIYHRRSTGPPDPA
jgi:hypothetical protein